MRETLKQLKEKRDAEDDEAFEIGSVYDLALGLELWLTDNSKGTTLFKRDTQQVSCLIGDPDSFGWNSHVQEVLCVCVCACR